MADRTTATAVKTTLIEVAAARSTGAPINTGRIVRFNTQLIATPNVFPARISNIVIFQDCFSDPEWVVVNVVHFSLLT